MNSLLNGMGGGGNNIMAQAFAAMMSGQSPKQFLMNLAKSNPQLQGLDFDNLEQTANKVCADNGQDPETLKNKIMSKFTNI